MHAIITVETANSSIKANFLKEIEMMKKVSGTGNELSKFVVNMVGCCTMQEPLLLVLEYIKHGDLLTYLRSRRQKGNVNHLYQFLCMHTMTLFPNCVYFSEHVYIFCIIQAESLQDAVPYLVSKASLYYIMQSPNTWSFIMHATNILLLIKSILISSV